MVPVVLEDMLRFSHVEFSNNLIRDPYIFDFLETDETTELVEKIRLLKKALDDNRLTLVCGAGVSKESGIPDWNELLVRILNKHVLNTSEYMEQADNAVISAKGLLLRLPSSNLILGKYLRIILQDDFDEIVRKCLYDKVWFNHEFMGQMPNISPLETNMIKAIVEIARPKRNKKGIESIITSNFDDLIESALTQQHIKHRPIWSEGQFYGADELLIYHVQGFLQQHGRLDPPNLVFSEEAYHSQFIDPYSWANLVQLNTFSSNICLFVGLSLSDPNLRRLLDISWRKNARCRHYIISKRPEQKEIIDKIATILFEQDASSLGLNVIWISEFSEITDILKKIVV
jgi:hypothetical protein